MIKTGDLVHVPENVLLFDPTSKDEETKFDYTYTLSPQVGMVLGEPLFFSDQRVQLSQITTVRYFVWEEFIMSTGKVSFPSKKENEYVSGIGRGKKEK